MCLGLWDMGWEREDWYGWGDFGLVCVVRRGCVSVLVCGLGCLCLMLRFEWI